MRSKYQRYLETDEWKALRERAFEKHGRDCYGCGKEAKIIHHRRYKKNVFKGRRLDLLVPVCPTCHHRIHARRPKLRYVNERLEKIRFDRLWPNGKPTRGEKRTQKWHDDSPKPLRSQGAVVGGVWRSEQGETRA